MIAIVVPVLGRPHRVRPLLENIASVTRTPHRVLFVASPGDEVQLNELRSAGADHIVLEHPPGPGDYARKINAGYRQTSEPYIFTGADDLLFHEGWDRAALDSFDDGIGVVGTDDLCNSRVIKGEHSTHSLIARWYADEQGTIDGPGAIYAECYPHEFCDDEMVETARFREAWAFARESVVEHLHPNCGKASNDVLYDAASKRLQQGRRIYQQRRRRWQPVPTAPISVIVATYGDDSWKEIAKKAVASVERQKLQPAQLITIHGESLAQARNDGALQATSEWLCFLDADDELHPNFFKAMSRHTSKRVGLLNPAVRFVTNGRPKPPRVFKPVDLSHGNYLVIGTVVRRELFFGAGGFDEQWEAWEDWALWRRVVALGGQILSVPNAVYVAHWRQDGRNNTIRDKQGLRDRINRDFEEWQRVSATG
jgi:glycosyltransferase involved in cell wall biosynthesis